MTKAAKIEVLVELFQNGFLCDCNQHDEVLDEDRNLIYTELQHRLDCKGRIKAMEILADVETDWTRYEQEP